MIRPSAAALTRRQRLFVLSALIPAVLLPIAFLVASSRSNRAAGLPLDDSWIHIRYADNLARGHGLSLNKGYPTPGATSPLWVAVVAAADKLGFPVVAAGQALSILFNALSVIAVYHLAILFVGPRFAWAAGLLCGCSGALAWSAGGALELGLFNFLSLHAIRVHAANTDRRWGRAAGAAVLLGLAAWARPEAVGLLAALAASAAWHTVLLRPARSSLAKQLAQAASQVLLVLAVAAPYSWFCCVTTGRPLPTTFYVKAGAPFSLAFVGQCVMQFVRTLRAESTLTAIACAVGAGVTIGRMFSRPRQLALAAWVVGLPIAYGVIGNTEAGANFGRHFYILIPSVMILAVVGLLAMTQAAVRLCRSRPFTRHFLCLALAVLALDLVWHAVDRGRQFMRNVKNVNEMQVAAAAWVRDNVPRRCTVAVNDIGAISFIADRPVIDLRGIATPEILPFLEVYGRPGEPTRDSGALEFIKSVRPDYLILFPEWYPRTLSELLRGRVVRREVVFALEDNITCGGDTMVVLKADWKGR